jgi:hypothetical protein
LTAAEDTPTNLKSKLPAMPVSKSVSKCIVLLSWQIVKIVILNPSNEAPIPIWQVKKEEEKRNCSDSPHRRNTQYFYI